MTTNDIDAIRQRPLADEPGNSTFAVWFDPNREPYAVYFRSDDNAWDDDQRWFNADQAGGDLDGPYSWDNLREELRGNDGPHLLVPGAKVDELTAALTESREQAATYANEIGNLTAENTRLRQQRDGLLADLTDAGNEVDLLTAENTRLRPVVEAAKAWRGQFAKAPITKGPRMTALMDAVDALPKAEATR